MITKRPLSMYVAAASVASVLSLPATSNARAADAFTFAILADGPYGEAAEPSYDNLIDSVNADESVQFVIHAGDIKAGGEMCSDELLDRRYAQFQRFVVPFVYTPGDNEWTDCHRTSNGSFLPTERLEYIRTLFFPQRGMTSGQNPMAVSTQSSSEGFEPFVENTLFSKEGVVFSQLHVVGSNNNLAPWNQIDDTDTLETPRADRLAEFEGREEASVEWLNHTFDVAMQDEAAGVFLTIHANPRFDLNSQEPEREGFNRFLDVLLNRTTQFGKPVVLSHGDSHVFFIDTPRLVPYYANADATSESDNHKVPNLTRVEVFGDTENHWIKVTVDTSTSNVFQFAPQIVAANITPANEIRLAGTVYSSSALELFWDRVYLDGVEASYEISRNGELLNTLDGSSYFEQGLSAGTPYTYTLVAVSEDGQTRQQATLTLTTNEQ